MASLSSRVSGHLEDAYLTLALDIIYSFIQWELACGSLIFKCGGFYQFRGTANAAASSGNKLNR